MADHPSNNTPHPAPGARYGRPVGRPYARWALALPPLLFFALFFVYPLAAIFQVSLIPGGQPDLSGFVRLATTPYYQETFLFTLGQALLSTALTLLLALPAAAVFARYAFPGKNLLLSLTALSFVLPTVVAAAAWLALIGPRGVLNGWLMQTFGLEAPPIRLERTLALVLLVHVFYNVPVALRLIAGAWSNLDPRLEEAARSLGARGWRLWWHIRLPLLRPAILAAAALVFLFTFTSFGVVLILGGPQFATVEVEIWRQARDLFNLPMAAALSLTQLVFMFGVLAAYTRTQRRLSSELVSARRAARPPRTMGERVFIIVTLGWLSLLLFAPLLALVWRSFSAGGEGFTLRYYDLLDENTRSSVLFVPPLQAIGTSLGYAALTTGVSAALGLSIAALLASRGEGIQRAARWLDPLLMLPLATSAVTLGFGFLIALDEPPLDLRASPLIIPIAHTLVATPFVVRSVLPALRAIPPHVQEAARGLGASPWQVWRWIDLPLAGRGLLTGAVFSFTVSMGEFGASLFVARPDTPTLPIAIYRLLGQPGAANYGQALAMSALLLLACALGFILIERLRAAGVGEF